MQQSNPSNCHLKTLSLVQFKNYEQKEFDFCSKINCLVGNNGTGKTNVLDAIYYLSMTKSCFNTTDTQNIRYGSDFFMIQGEYDRENTPENIYCGVKRGQKKVFRRNKKDYDRLSDHIGLIPIVMISPADINLIIGGSEERRRFINEVISQYDHQYMHNMMSYNHALEQRNALLKKFAESRWFDAGMLEIWNEQLVASGEKIFKCRTEFCQELIPVFQQYYQEISGGNEQVQLIYHSQLHDCDYAQLLREAEPKDRFLQYTTVGVHKDDLLLQMNDFPIKRSASQGQQKTFLVSLKLANFDFIRRHCNINPLLLLDDIFDKFDAQRVSHIIHLVAGDDFGQIFITDTGREHIDSILKQTDCDYLVFEII